MDAAVLTVLQTHVGGRLLLFLTGQEGIETVGDQAEDRELSGQR